MKLPVKFTLSAFLLFICAIDSTFADPEYAPAPGDFAYSRTVTPQNQLPVQFFHVPDELYTHVTSKTLTDVRLYNQEGGAVPFEITKIADIFAKHVAATTVPFYPVETSRLSESAASKNSNEMAIDLTQDSSGNILSVHVKGSSKKTSLSHHAYLLDMRSILTTIKDISITWSGPTGKIIPVSFSASDDLEHWSPDTSGVLARLSYQGHMIEKKLIHGPFRKSDYLRMDINTAQDITISEISATLESTFLQSTTDAELPLQALDSTPLRTVYEYDTNGVFPIHSFRPEFNTNNILANITLSSRSNQNVPWVTRFSGPVYSLSMMETAFESGLKKLTAMTTDRYWKLESNDHEMTFPKAPSINFQWQRHTLRFLAQGSPPFLLAYGNAAITSLPSTGSAIGSLTNEETLSIGASLLGEAQPLRGQAALIPPPPVAPVEWHKWALWGVLILVLGMVALMALKLVQEMQREG